MKWFPIVALVLFGCPVPEPELDGGTLPDGGACPSGAELGTELDGDGGARSYSELNDGAQLLINRGPQGGWHVWVSVRARSLSRTGTLSYTLRSNSVVVSAPLRLELQNLVLDPITCGWERRSDALTFESNGEAYRGAQGELELRLEKFGVTPVVVKRTVTLF